MEGLSYGLTSEYKEELVDVVMYIDGRKLIISDIVGLVKSSIDDDNLDIILPEDSRILVEQEIENFRNDIKN